MGFRANLKKGLNETSRQVVRDIRSCRWLGGEIRQPLSANAANARFRYMTIGSGQVDLARAPDFLIAGPQRTGTTWLHAILTRHPEIFLPDKKEIYYFNTLNLPTHPKHRTNDLAWYLDHFYPGPCTFLRKDRDCRRLFGQPFRPRLRGESTASLAAMPPELIAEVIALNPRIKVIILVRDPIERAWSDAKLIQRKSGARDIADIPLDRLERFIRDDYQIACGHYTRIIENWSGVLGQGQLFLGNFIDIEYRPRELLRDILAFLGVTSKPELLRLQGAEKVNATSDAPIPAAIEPLLQSLYAEEREELVRRGFRFARREE